MPVEVKIRKGEPMERALRRLKKKLDREGVIRDVRAKRYFEKPSEVKRRKKKVAAFSAMLRARYENR
ncbi:MAG: small subunit ribosomal protein S21 [Puniceicoccaceae bacterium 5H]|nr:MAG: small subunit ribosomal protein S21 [Puniceicoccaceae bacterium 5H]MDP0500491.1 30S ribosomal protein S21 [Verrucomicrobiota bacterium JB022]